MEAEKARILYVEDDESLSFVTVDNLQLAGYSVCHCADGQDALNHFAEQPFDICILDVMLPGVDGFSIAEQIREVNEEVPVLFLTAKSLKEDKIKGLRLGADDYITKPFSMEELLLKIQVFLRRTGKTRKAPSRFGQYDLDYENLQLCHNDELVRKLTQKEADLLYYLLSHRNNVLKRSDILVKLWGKDDYFLGRSLDVFISRLRKYLAKDERISLENIHGVGFRLNIPEESS